MEHKEKIKELIVNGHIELGITLAQGQGYSNTELIELITLANEEMTTNLIRCDYVMKRINIGYHLKLNGILQKLLEERQEELKLEIVDIELKENV